jgi:hypothetical protein
MTISDALKVILFTIFPSPSGLWRAAEVRRCEFKTLEFKHKTPLDTIYAGCNPQTDPRGETGWGRHASHVKIT